MAGNESIGFSNGTFLSERDNADRNYALAYYMRENKCFPQKCDLMGTLDLYFQVSFVNEKGEIYARILEGGSGNFRQIMNAFAEVLYLR